jgi:hypothetical protein
MNACGQYSPSECLMIGDTIDKDVLGPNKYGIDSIYYNPALFSLVTCVYLNQFVNTTKLLFFDFKYFNISVVSDSRISLISAFIFIQPSIISLVIFIPVLFL